MRFMPNSFKNNCTCDELHICNFCSNTYNIVMNSKDQNMNNIEENVTLDKAPRGYMWVIYDNDTQTTIVDGLECSEDATNTLPTLAGGDYSIFCIPMGMEVVKTTHYKEGVSDISYTVQDKKEE